MSKKSLQHHIKHHVDKRLQMQLRIFFFISFVMVCIVGYDIFNQYISIPFALGGIGVGIIVGIISARMFHISWNHNAKKIMARLDAFGVSILIAYIFFSLFRNQLVGFVVHGPTVGAVSFSVLAGSMIGRIIGTRGKIVKILKEQEII